MLGTENRVAVWHDRKLYETIISQPGERISGIPRKKKLNQYERVERKKAGNKYVK